MLSNPDSEFSQIFPDENLDSTQNTTYLEEEKENEKTNFEIRNYQIQIYEKVENEKNSIIVLETGTGKTMIAILLIYFHLEKYKLQKKVRIISIRHKFVYRLFLLQILCNCVSSNLMKL